MNIWKEIRCNHFDDIEQKTFIDAWTTGDDNEEGKVIAKVDINYNIEYLDERAKSDKYAQEIIVDAIFDTFADKAYDLYVKDWCDSRGYDITNYDDENGFNGESYVCFSEFRDAEFRDKEYMNYLLSDSDFKIWQDVIQNQNLGGKLMAKFILITVCNRDISTEFFSDFDSAYEQMEHEYKEIIEDKDLNEEDLDEYDYDIDKNTAWVTTNNDNYDWLICEIIK